MATSASSSDHHPPPMPIRSSSTMGSDDVGDPSDPLYARFKTWRHVIGNLIEYFEQIESMHKTQSKEYAKLSKTLEVPFKTAEFAVDGVTTIWQAMRDKAVQMSTFYQEEADILKAGIIAELTRLRADIKKHLGDLDKEGVQGSKKVGKKMDKFSDQTQSLGKWIPVAETNPTSLDAHHEPYVLWRQTRHKLYRAVDEENQLNEQLFALQTRCQHYETIIVQGIQKAIKDYSEHTTKESQYSTTVAAELNAIALGVPPGKEWESFTNREPALLKPDHKPRDPLTATFPFHDHPLTKPILEGRLDRKSTVLKRRQPAEYVLTPSGFLLEYKDADAVLNPDPTLSLKLCDCTLGPRGDKSGFTLRGKDVGKSFGPSRSHEYVFHTDSPHQATLWWDAISKYTSNEATPLTPTSNEPTALSVNTTKPVAVPPSTQHVAPATVQTPTPGASATVHQPVQTALPTHYDGGYGNVPTTTAAPTSTGHAQAAATAASHGTAPPTTTRGTF